MEAPTIIWNAGHDKKKCMFLLIKMQNTKQNWNILLCDWPQHSKHSKTGFSSFFPVMFKSDSVQLSSVSSKYLILLYYNITMQITWFSLRNNNNINLYVALSVWK